MEPHNIINSTAKLFCADCQQFATCKLKGGNCLELLPVLFTFKWKSAHVEQANQTVVTTKPLKIWRSDSPLNAKMQTSCPCFQSCLSEDAHSFGHFSGLASAFPTSHLHIWILVNSCHHLFTELTKQFPNERQHFINSISASNLQKSGSSLAAKTLSLKLLPPQRGASPTEGTQLQTSSASVEPQIIA